MTKQACLQQLSYRAKRLLTLHFGIVNRVLIEHHDGARTGSSLHIRNEMGHVLMTERSRPPAPEDDACRYDFFASEKTFRLWGNPSHTLSWESHDMDRKQYPGGARFIKMGIVMAISGFTAEEDEAGVLWIGTRMNWISGPDAYEAAQISSNSRYAELFQQLNGAVATS